MTAKGQLRSFCFMLIQGYGAMLNCTSPTPRSLVAALEKDLFPYRQVRPVKDFSSPLNITLDITVVGVLGVDPISQTLTMLIWQVLEWDIDGLSWDVQECGTEKVSVLRERIWVPDVHIAEFMEENKSPRTPYVYLYNTGVVFDDRPIRVVSSCKLDIYTFPFDIQNCTLTFGSYVHFASEIRMSQGSTAEDVLQESREVFETNGEWDLADIQAVPFTLSLGEDDYSEIKYFLILRRKPLNYVVNLLIPSCFLVTIDIFSFMLPPHSVDRSSFKMTLILGYTVFLLIMNDLLPVTGNQTPLISYGAMLNCTSPTPRSLVADLEKDLFPYRQVRPVKDFSSPLNITLDITVVGVLGVVLEWDIDGLSWDVQECGTEKVSVLRESIWVPDVHIAEL
eukprot:XP_011613251.1 PREDICTED: 5-hydroxytryptamine receptor 3C-like [Takifugu rubripes]